MNLFPRSASEDKNFRILFDDIVFYKTRLYLLVHIHTLPYNITSYICYTVISLTVSYYSFVEIFAIFLEKDN